MSQINPILNCRAFIETFEKIRTKEGKVEPFHLNAPQQRLYDAIRQQWKAGKPVRIVILKARQMGFSTLTEGVIFWLAVTACNMSCMIVAHQEAATANLFAMSQRFYDLLPDRIKPLQKASNGNELVFDRPSRYRGKRKGLGSRIKCATAGGKGIGRSDTIQALHISELAFWPGDARENYTGLMQAVPDTPGSLVIIESTANGYNFFKEVWDKAVEARRSGEDGFIPIFFAWWEMQEYRRAVPPGFQRTPEEEELARTYNLDDEQLAWRRWKIREAMNGDVDQFRQEYPSSPDEAFLATGDCFFDKEQLVLMREQARKEVWSRGYFRMEKDFTDRIVDFRWVEDPRGAIRIRKMPEEGVPYVIGGDTAGEGSDFFVGQVLDNRTGDQVAVLHHRYGEREYAQQMYCLGMYYNQALLGIETNFSTYPQKALEDLGYPNFYVRESLDTYTGKLVPSYGFQTGKKTRPFALDGLKDVAAHSPELIHDWETMGEMLVFVKNQQGRPEAEVGEHDDLVMALAIAHYIRSQQTTRATGGTQGETRQAPGRRWTEDMWEDYRNTDAAGRLYLEKKWGPPT